MPRYFISQALFCPGGNPPQLTAIVIETRYNGRDNLNRYPVIASSFAFPRDRR